MPLTGVGAAGTASTRDRFRARALERGDVVGPPTVATSPSEAAAVLATPAPTVGPGSPRARAWTWEQRGAGIGAGTYKTPYLCEASEAVQDNVLATYARTLAWELCMHPAAP